MKRSRDVALRLGCFFLLLLGVVNSAGASVIMGGTPPATGPAPGERDTAYSAGLYTFLKPDFNLAGPLNVSMNRVYRSNDQNSSGTWNVRSFGVGFRMSYDMFLYSRSEASGQGYTDAELVLPDGGQIVCPRTSSCTQNGCIDYADAVFQCTGQPYNAYYGATISYDANLPGWDVILKNKGVFKFGLGAPLQSVADRNGNSVTLVRSGGQNGNVTQVSGSNGRYVNLYYNISGHPNLVSQAVDSSGRTIFYKYDSSQRLTGVAVGTSTTNQEKYTYVNGTTQLGNIATSQVLVSGTTYSSTSVAYTSDSNHFLSQITLPTGINNIWSYGYGLTGSMINNVTITDPLGYQNPGHHRRFLQFNSAGYKTSDTLAYGESLAETTTFIRGTNGFISSTTDQLGRETCYTYDSLENPLTITRLCGGWNGQSASTTTYTYGACSQVASVTDPDNVNVSGTFDPHCNLLTKTGGPHGTLALTYNTAGEIISFTDGNQNKTIVNYNPNTLDMSSVVDPLQNTFTVTEDGHGNVASFTDPYGHSSSYTFTGVGSSWSAGLFPDRISQIIDANSGTTTFQYDDLGNPVQITDANNHRWSYSYSGLINAVTLTDANGHYTSVFTDNLGNTSTLVGSNGNSAGFTRDDLGRATTIAYSSGNHSNTVSYTYDLGNRMTQAIDTSGGRPGVPGNTITRTYDGFNNMLTEAVPEGTVSYTYDAASLRRTMTAGSQAAVTYSYDAAERLASETNGTLSAAISYDAGGRRSCLTLPNGVIVGYVYNAASHVTSITYGTSGSCANPPTNLGNLTYTYDADSRRLSMGGSLASVTLPATVSSATYGKANELKTWNGANATNDLNNNLTKNPSNGDVYTWDFRNELTTTSSGNTYYYDAFKRRETIAQGSTTTSYLYDHLFPVHISNSSSGNTDYLASPGAAEEFAITTTAGTIVPIHDAIGSTIGRVNSQGALTQTSYSPFGASSSSTAQFNGQQLDSTPNLVAFPIRYYSPVLQRFLSEDPLRFSSDSTNFFQYALNSPVNLVDPSGLQAFAGDPASQGVGEIADAEAQVGAELASAGASLAPSSGGEAGALVGAVGVLVAVAFGVAITPAAVFTAGGYILGYTAYKLYTHFTTPTAPIPNVPGPVAPNVPIGPTIVSVGGFGEGPGSAVGSQNSADNSLAGATVAGWEAEAAQAADAQSGQGQGSDSGAGGGDPGGGSGGGGVGGGVGK